VRHACVCGGGGDLLHVKKLGSGPFLSAVSNNPSRLATLFCFPSACFPTQRGYVMILLFLFFLFPLLVVVVLCTCFSGLDLDSPLVPIQKPAPNRVLPPRL
jgi:hypothetical protein